MLDAMNKEFIGEEYNNNIEKQSILGKYDKFQLQKLEWLNETFDSEGTKMNYWSNYTNNIHYDEINKGKDVMHYNREEVVDLVSSAVHLEPPTRQQILTMIRGYCNWAKDDRRYINLNPADSISASDVNEVNAKFLAKRTIGMESFYEMCNLMEKHVESIDIMPLVLARYGIMGRRMENAISLRWDDIDRENMVANIVSDDGELITNLPIDNRFLNWVDKVKDLVKYENVSDSGRVYKEELEDHGYVLKKSARVKDDCVKDKYNTVNTKICNAFKSVHYERIPPSDLMMARKIEVLLGIREKRRLGKRDLEKVIRMFHTGNKTFSVAENNLKYKYETLSGDTILSKREKDYKYEDKNAETFVREFSKETGLEIIRLDLD